MVDPYPTAKYGDLYPQWITLLEVVQVEAIRLMVMDIAKQPPSLEIIDQVIIKDSTQLVEETDSSMKKDKISLEFMTNKYLSYHPHTLYLVKICSLPQLAKLFFAINFSVY